MVGPQTTRQESRFLLGLFNLVVLSEDLLPDYFQCIQVPCVDVQRVGRQLIFGKGYQMLDTNTTDNKNKVIKFKESAWKCIYFLSAEFLALYVTSKEPWFNNTRHFWVGPGDQVWPDQKIKRSDFGVLMGHHFATVTLVVLSYIFRYALETLTLIFGRVGSVVLAIHDASDVFLEIGKMSKYCGAEKLASIAFIIFVLSWIFLRLIYFPFWVLWSTSYEVVQTLDKEKHPVVGPICYYLFNTLLFCLLVLHIYWWVLMYRMLVNQIQAGGKISEDVRSDSEDEHED
ncbi:hypothetical protein GOBAR_DD21058 [Gossypium barbadense]|nr:hypothetical protein GOBAR_DD21058 [Gossypium barbadense]